eukprot:TRINITY_DN103984_c0_g1_i2.p1 TRINITY_DN103984_c0_g1~~TRINITY_DN103984_c0_g1_i2.p1  ORF type:complete len:631 (-),score=122.57 TRINITY_DN103984_c0_g1_i2:371-1981(-)
MPDPALEAAKVKLNELLADHQQLKAEVQVCWEAAHGEGDKISVQQLRALIEKFHQDVGVPSQAFGNVNKIYEKFDFDGDNTLSFREAYRCVKYCMGEWRDKEGIAPVETVPVKAPEQDGMVLIKVLAAGGQGEARLVHHPEHGEVVLKVYDKSNSNAPGIEDLQEEMHHMKAVDRSPNVAVCHEIFQDAGHFYMLSEAYYGGDWASLRKKTAKAGVPMDEEFYRTIFRQAFEGLAFLHKHAIMHCDIKEPNIMMRSDDYLNPEAVIIDFGLSKSFTEDVSGGTPGYMPPELVDIFAGGSGAWYPKGDVFSMGVTCLQLVTDQVPDADTGKTGVFTRGQVGASDWIGFTKTRQAPLNKVSFPSLKSMLTKCLQKNRKLRPTASQVLAEPWLKGEEDKTEQPAPRTSAPPQPVPSAVRQPVASQSRGSLPPQPVSSVVRQAVAPVAMQPVASQSRAVPCAAQTFPLRHAMPAGVTSPRVAMPPTVVGQPRVMGYPQLQQGVTYPGSAMGSGVMYPGSAMGSGGYVTPGAYGKPVYVRR